MDQDRSMLGRVLAIIDCCLEHDGPVPLAELAEETDLPKATAWRIAQRLADRHLLERSSAGYTGGVGLVAMGSRVSDHLALRAAATPHLAELHGQTAAAVWVVDVRSDIEWPLVSSIYSRSAAATRYTETWEHSPDDPAVLASALGVVAFAQRQDDADPLLKRGVPRLTPHTESNPVRIESMMDQVRHSAELVEHERFRLGWSCLAVPVRDETDRTIAVVGVVDRTPRFVAGRLLRAAHASADAMSGTLSSPSQL